MVGHLNLRSMAKAELIDSFPRPVAGVRLLLEISERRLRMMSRAHGRGASPILPLASSQQQVDKGMVTIH